MKLRALLVDDEAPARKELRYLLQHFPEIQIVGEAANAVEALELINNLDYSVVFLDIDMPGKKGIELAEKLKERKSAPSIIFTTAHEEFAVEAFSVNALDYLLKPISFKRLEEALKKLMRQKSLMINEQKNEEKENHPMEKAEQTSEHEASQNTTSSESTQRLLEVVPVEKRGKTILLRPEEIIYIYTDKENVLIKTQKESFLTRFTLKELESRLNPNLFFRTHRGYIVNIKHMRELVPYFNGTYSVIVDDQERSEVPVSRIQSRKLKNYLGL